MFHSLRKWKYSPVKPPVTALTVKSTVMKFRLIEHIILAHLLTLLYGDVYEVCSHFLCPPQGLIFR